MYRAGLESQPNLGLAPAPMFALTRLQLESAYINRVMPYKKGGPVQEK